jgi:hypothetical protein
MSNVRYCDPNGKVRITVFLKAIIRIENLEYNAKSNYEMASTNFISEQRSK